MSSKSTNDTEHYMILAVMSYPKHFHITQLSIKHALKRIPDITEVAIIWDDNHIQKPSMSLDQVVQLNIPCYVYPWSDIIPIGDKAHGWLGQQLIKLHLDVVIKKECIILDGDLIINQNIDPKNITYANELPMRHPRYNHINEILGLGVYEFATCPFMYVQTSWLKDIRELSKLHSHMDFIDRFLLASKYSRTLAEWELIASYIFNVLKLSRKVEYFHRKPVKPNHFVQEYNTVENFVLDGPDDIDLKFFKGNNIFIDIKLMKELEYKCVT